MAIFQWCEPLQATPLQYELVNLPVLKPAASIGQSIEADAPVETAVLANDGALWMLGKSNLWRWYPLTGVVQKIQLGNIFSEADHRAIGVAGDSIFVALNGRVWQLAGRSNDMMPYEGAWEKNCRQSRFFGDGDRLFVSNSCGLWQIDRYGQRLVSMKIPSGGEQWDAWAQAPHCDCLFVARRRELFQWTWSGARIREERIYSAKSKILGVKWSGTHLIAWTAHALLVFDAATGKRQQVVTVASHRTIAAADFSASLHVVGFDDGTFEWLGIKDQKAWTSRLPALKPTEIILDPSGSYAVIRGVGTPVAVGLTGLKITSP